MANLTSTLTIKLLDGVSGPASTIAAALKKLHAESRALSSSAKSGGGLNGFGANAAEIKRVGDAWRDYGRSARFAARASDWVSTQRSQMKAWEVSTVSSLRAVEREQSRLARAARSTGVDLARRRDVHGTLGAIAIAAAAERASHVAVRGIKQGATLEHERVRMSAAGMSPPEIQRAQEEAYKIAAETKLINVGEGMHMIRNIRSVVGSVEEALHMAEPIAKMRATVQAAHPEKDIGDDFDQLIKGLEIKGVTQNMGQFRSYIEGMTKALNVFGDTLKPADYYQMFKYARQAGPRLSQEYMLGVAPTIAQELRGSSAGNAMSGFNQTIVGGKMKPVAAEEFEKLGLLDPGSVIRTKGGAVKGFRSGGMKGADLAATDQYRWTQEVLKPAMIAHGYDTKDKQLDQLPRLFANRVEAQLVGILLTQADKIEKDRALIHGAKGTDALDDYQKQDPRVGAKALNETFDTLLATLTNPLMPAASAGMSAFSSGLSKLSAVLANHELATGALAVTAGVGTLGLAAKSIMNISGLLTGGGASVALNGSAAALTGSATALSGAAFKLGASQGIPGLFGGGGPAAKGGLFLKGLKAIPYIGMGIAAYEVLDEIEQYSKKANAGLPPSRAEVLTDGSSITPAERQDAYRKEVEAGRGAAADLASTQDNSRRANADSSEAKARAQGEADAHDEALDRLRAKATDTGQAVTTALNVTASPEINLTSFDQALARIAQIRREMETLGPLSQSIGGIGKSPFRGYPSLTFYGTAQGQ